MANNANRKFQKDLTMVVLSNGFLLISSIISGFFVPRLLGVTEYGYYQTFSLYLTYTALLHFGFVDGVLLKYAGTEYKEIDKRQFTTNTRFYVLLQIVVVILLIIVSFSFADGMIRNIFLFISFDTLFINITTYYQYISQSTMRFNELSLRKVLQAVLKIIIVLVLYFFHKTGEMPTITAYHYIAGVCVVDMILALWYMYTYREITFGKSYKFFSCIDEYKELFRSGIILTLSYQVAHLIFILDKQFVVQLYDTDTYALYAFAYSLVSMFTTIITAVSIVLFPNMKKKKDEENIKEYDDWISIIAIAVFAALAGYYILRYVLVWIVPMYESSLEYVRIIFPGLAISCIITIITFNYYKVFHKISLYMIISFIILAIGGILNWFAHKLLHTPAAISVASIITLHIWFIWLQLFFVKEYKIKPWKTYAYIVVLSTIFWVSTISKLNNLWGMGIYILAYFLLTTIFHRNILESRIAPMHRKGRLESRNPER